MEGPPSPAVLGDSLAAPGGPDGVARVTGQGSADNQRIFAWSAMCRNQKVQLKPVSATSTAIRNATAVPAQPRAVEVNTKTVPAALDTAIITMTITPRPPWRAVAVAIDQVRSRDCWMITVFVRGGVIIIGTLRRVVQVFALFFFVTMVLKRNDSHWEVWMLLYGGAGVGE